MTTAPDQWLPLSEARGWWPADAGPAPSKTTLLRWSRSGIGGERLRLLKRGKLLFVAESELQRFLTAVLEHRGEGEPG